MIVGLIVFLVCITAVSIIAILIRKKSSYDDAHKIAEAARRRIGQKSGPNAKSAESAKTAQKTVKKSVSFKEKESSVNENTGGNKESWQSYNTMLRTRYPNMNQYLVLRSWVHPTRPGEYDSGLALIRTGEIWYFCVDDYFFCVGEDMFKHNCYRLPDDFFDNTTWDNLEDKLRSVNWEAGSAVSSLFICEAEDKAEIEKLFTRSPYRTMFKTAYERNFLGQGQRPYSCILETKESVLSIHIETGELTEKTRSIVQEFYASESYDDPISPYEVTHSERAVSYDELDSLIEASEDKAAEQYKGMTADNWREYF